MLSSHHMDEADVLGDRIAIISSKFLSKFFIILNILDLFLIQMDKLNVEIGRAHV